MMFVYALDLIIMPSICDATKPPIASCAARIYGAGNDFLEERLRSFLPHAILALAFMSGCSAQIRIASAILRCAQNDKFANNLG